MFGCFGKEKLVEEGEDANDVFLRLITEGEELPQDTTLEVFGGPDRVGARRILFRLSYTHHDHYRQSYYFQQNYGGNNVVFNFPGAILIQLLDEKNPVRAQHPVLGEYKNKKIFYIFYNYQFGISGMRGHQHLDVLQSGKINEEVAKNTMKGANKAKKEEKAAAKEAAKEAKAAAKETKAEANKAKKLGISPEAYQSGKEYFTGTPDAIGKTGFTVGADESIEVKATDHEPQPETEHILAQSIDASMEVAALKSPHHNVGMGRSNIMMPGSEGGDFVRQGPQTKTRNVPTSAEAHDEDMMMRRLVTSRQRWTEAQQLEGDGNAVTEHAKTHHLGLFKEAQQKHVAARADRPSMRIQGPEGPE